MVEKKVLAKVIILGEMGVGKTALVNSFIGNSGKTKATVGNDFRKKDITVGDITVTL